MQSITWEDFEKIDLRAGTITRAGRFEEAKTPAYKLWIDFGGTLGVKKTSAQITNYDLNHLVGLQVICVVNFEPKQVANFMSEVLVTGFVLENKTILSAPKSLVPNGTAMR
jgi:tRNA-binding protein